MQKSYHPKQKDVIMAGENKLGKNIVKWLNMSNN